jgi:hypothetical protein
MNIPEYYLNLLGGWNGADDETHYGARPILAAIMSHYKVRATTKTDLVREMGLGATPGFLLGQRETTMSSYYVKNYEHRRFCSRLVEFKKVGRTFNYLLNWDVVSDTDFNMGFYSPNWSSIAQVYWWGRLMFGHNVIPESVITVLRSRMVVKNDRRDEYRNAYNPFVVQFLRDNDLMPTGNHHPEARAGNSVLDREIPYWEVMLSFACSIATTNNVAGYYSSLASLSRVLIPRPVDHDSASGMKIDCVQDAERKLDPYFKWWDPSSSRPLNGSWQYGIGQPSIERALRPNGFPSNVREMIPLFMGHLHMTPLEEQRNNYKTPYVGYDVNMSGRNKYAYALSCLLYEFGLLVNNTALFDLSILKRIREEKEWDDAGIIAAAEGLSMLGIKNHTIHRIVGFNIERQNQV